MYSRCTLKIFTTSLQKGIRSQFYACSLIAARKRSPYFSYLNSPTPDTESISSLFAGFINDTGKELPTIIAFEDILEIGVNIT